MGADNGMVIKKFSDTDFKVYEYDNSSGSETLRGSYFTTLEEALEFASAQQAEFGVTYEDKSSREHKIETTIDELRQHLFSTSFCNYPDEAKVTIEWGINKK